MSSEDPDSQCPRCYSSVVNHLPWCLQQRVESGGCDLESLGVKVECLPGYNWKFYKLYV